jgi:hypothetical protein
MVMDNVPWRVVGMEATARPGMATVVLRREPATGEIETITGEIETMKIMSDEAYKLRLGTLVKFKLEIVEP